MSIRIDEYVALAPWHTFGVTAKTRYFTHLYHSGDLEELLQHPVYLRQRRLLLGGGSNVLFVRDFDGLVIHVAIGGISEDESDDDHVLVKAGGGIIWNDLVRYCVDRGYGGIENLTLIPGTVGAAPIQNIGAYGAELKSVFDHLEACDLETGRMACFGRDDCRFGYRDSYFKHEGKGRWLITSVTLRLARNPRLNLGYGAIRETLQARGINPDDATIAHVSDVVAHIRRIKLPDPVKTGNAGSFFQNPLISESRYKELNRLFPGMPGYPVPGHHVKVPAGWLIEQCGYKGYHKGDAGVYDKQALVLVNYGGATGGEIYELSLEIMAKVKERFGIALNPEVNLIT